MRFLIESCVRFYLFETTFISLEAVQKGISQNLSEGNRKTRTFEISGHKLFATSDHTGRI